VLDAVVDDTEGVRQLEMDAPSRLEACEPISVFVKPGKALSQVLFGEEAKRNALLKDWLRYCLIGVQKGIRARAGFRGGGCRRCGCEQKHATCQGDEHSPLQHELDFTDLAAQPPVFNNLGRVPAGQLISFSGILNVVFWLSVPPQRPGVCLEKLDSRTIVAWLTFRRLRMPIVRRLVSNRLGESSGRL
jgi:hypothetical protein